MDARRASALAEGARSELLFLLRDLIAAPSPRGSSGRSAQERLGSYLDHRGFAVELTEGANPPLGEHPDFSPPLPAGAEPPVNLVARTPGEETNGLTLFAHVDTEPPGEGWTLPPYEASLRNGRLHGLGAADDKGGLAAAAVAAALSLRHGGAAPRLLSLHGKGGGARGTLPVFARLGGVGECLYVHPPESGAGLSVLKSASRGVLDLTLRVTGWRGRPREIRTPESAPFEEGESALEACFELVETLCGGELSDCELNLGRVEGGESAGLTPLRCDGEVRVLFRGKHTVRKVLAAVRRAAAGIERRRSGPGGSVRFEIGAEGLRANPAETPWDDPFTAGLRSAAADITGAEPVSSTDHLASDIRFPIRLSGVPCLGIGSLGGNFYGPDEWVDLEDLVRLVAVLLLFGWRRGREERQKTPPERTP